MKVDTKRTTSFPARLKFLLFACIFEVSLGIAALLWANASGLEVYFLPSFHSAVFGAFAAIPLLVLNGALYYFMIRHHKNSPFGTFFRQVIIPLCQQQTIPSAVCIGIVSGFGEELFFRGVLTQQLLVYSPLPLTIVLVNLLFAYVHFIGAIKVFGRVVFFYFLFGLYFSFIVAFKLDLFAVVICHGFYNTIVILVVRHLFFVKTTDSTLAEC